MNIFNKESAYVLYEIPCFKVQVGDYRWKLEAEKKLIKIKKNYPDSFIVKTKINPLKTN